MEKENKYTVSIYTENSVGLLNRISAIFQRRHINIESFNEEGTRYIRFPKNSTCKLRH